MLKVTTWNKWISGSQPIVDLVWQSLFYAQPIVSSSNRTLIDIQQKGISP